MSNGITQFSVGAKAKPSYGKYAYSTLLDMTKRDLIDYIRCLEKNLSIANQFNKQQAKNCEALLVKGERFKEYFDELYGLNLYVANWHMNGALEPFDNFYESAIDYMEGTDGKTNRGEN